MLQLICCRVAAIAQWFHLRLPSCSPGFKSQAHHLRFFSICIEIVLRKEQKINKKRLGLAHFFKKKFVVPFSIHISRSKINISQCQAWEAWSWMWCQANSLCDDLTVIWICRICSQEWPYYGLWFRSYTLEEI